MLNVCLRHMHDLEPGSPAPNTPFGLLPVLVEEPLVQHPTARAQAPGQEDPWERLQQIKDR